MKKKDKEVPAKKQPGITSPQSVAMALKGASKVPPWMQKKAKK